MAHFEDLKTELKVIHEVIDEIAVDVDDLVNKFGEGSLSDAQVSEIKGDLVALKTRLQAVAAVHTPDSTDPSLDPFL